MSARFRSLLATTLAGALAAQQAPTVLPAPADLLASFGLRAGTAQSLLLPMTQDRPFTVDVVLDGAVRTLDLIPHDVRSRDFRLLVDDGHSLRQVATPASVTFRGTLRGRPGSAVAASLVAGQLSAQVLLADGSSYGIQPLTEVAPALPRQAHVVYRGQDVVRPDVHCGVSGLPRQVEGAPRGGVGPAAIKIAEIAVDADRAYYARYGSNATTVQNQVTSVINAMGVIYRRDVEIDYTITTILVRTVNIYAWNGDLCNLLGQFANYWSANHANVRRDVAHLFTGEGSFSGVIGCAYLGVVCTGSGYGASKAFSANLSTNTGLVSHEVGHNWNAPHCDGSSPCNIMCSGLGGCSRNIGAFAPVSVGQIVAFKNTRTCLGDATPPTLTAINPTSVTSFQPVEVTATGVLLDSATSVSVGGRNVPFTRVNATTLRLSPPTPFAIGPQPVVVTNGAGPSNPINLTVTGNHPSVISATQIVLRSFNNPVDLHSDANWAGLLLLSTSNVPSRLPGVVDLGIGNAFSELIDYGTTLCNQEGTGLWLLNLPQSVPSGLTIYLQAVTLDPQNPTTPLETSNVRQVQVL
ncbi:MAG: M12 family metallo-peptidase [Planctomycetota bacterium]